MAADPIRPISPHRCGGSSVRSAVAAAAADLCGDDDAPRYSRAVTANEVVGIQRRRHLEGVEAQAPARQPTRPPEEPARLPEGVSGLNIQLDGANGAPIIEQLAEAIAAHYGRVIEVPTPRACPPPGCTYYGCTFCGCTYYGCT